MKSGLEATAKSQKRYYIQNIKSKLNPEVKHNKCSNNTRPTPHQLKLNRVQS